MDKKAMGLFEKFLVTRTDGASEEGGKHFECEYFVLDITHDPFAVHALFAYADVCEEGGYHRLAEDLRTVARRQAVTNARSQNLNVRSWFRNRRDKPDA